MGIFRKKSLLITKKVLKIKCLQKVRYKLDFNFSDIPLKHSQTDGWLQDVTEDNVKQILNAMQKCPSHCVVYHL